MQGLFLQLTRVGFLLLLWIFIFAAIRVMRSDLQAASGLRGATAPKGATISRRDRRKSASLLVVTEGALAGTKIELGTGPITIGRADDSTLVLTDDYASTRHARITPRGLDWYLEDLGSTNGTYLDREKVTGEVRVPLGRAIRIGKTAIELRP